MKHHIATKFIAMLLCACSLFLIVAGSLGITVSCALNLYQQTPQELIAEEQHRILDSYANMIIAKYAGKHIGNCPDSFLERLNYDNYSENYLNFRLSNVSYTIKSDQGFPLESTYAGQSDAEKYDAQPVSNRYPKVVAVDQQPISQGAEMEPSEPFTATDFDEVYREIDSDFNTLSRYYILWQKSPTYSVTLYYLPEAFETNTSFVYIQLLWQYRYHFLVILTAALLLFAIMAVYLCCAAGRKPGTTEIRPSGLNQLPIDLYAVVALGIGSFLVFLDCWLIDQPVRQKSTVMLYFVALVSLLLCLLVIGWLYCLVAQWKAGKGYLWKHSIVGRFCRLLYHGCRWLVCMIFQLFSLLPLMWQWLLTAFIMATLLLFAIATGSFIMFLLAVALCIGIIVYGAYAFGLLLSSAKEMSEGNLNSKIKESCLFGCFRDFASHLNALAGAAIIAAQKQMKSERMKTELITNVSHDIKTPLTSIINYVDLLQKDPSQEDAKQYLDVLSRQSQRMKKLIDDLMEMSKASTGNLPAEITRVNAVEAINQALGEFSDKLDAAALTPVFSVPTQPVFMYADGRLTWRVLSNLLSNAVKYALPGTRLYLDLVALEDQVLISLKNISKEPLNISADELLERFVRGDVSRNTEGSGLGLNIAQSLMELQDGSLQLLIDGDLFKVTLLFPIAEES